LGEKQSAGSHLEVREPLHHSEDHGGTPHTPGTHRMLQCHIAVHADQRQEIDTAVVIHIDSHVDQATQQGAEGPVEAIGHIDSPEGEAGDQEQISGSQVSQVDLCYGAGLLMQAEHQQDKPVIQNPQYAGGQDVGQLRGVKPVPLLSVRAVAGVGTVASSHVYGAGENMLCKCNCGCSRRGTWVYGR
uniref:Uncharacterized protein n=1 Tax=Oncorhynchus kisutch TaxID=8019 RepID=A0A8C7GT48_ONCKI